ncbi:hypothetical protein Ddye_007478 [Dipteronia dyeriana]|uniref:Uncharacterized protein n=1 Tax=Dipteronia dyeriana TaxID=168575 RepID=A0AAD9XK26_9ROSI|nr:hypothetical protein Ddye_007478 [Dipteronia dyeriana]
MQVAVGHFLVLLHSFYGLRFMEFERMKLEKMCPPGPLSISFSLPDQVDPHMFSSTYRPDGILEVIVRKRKFPCNTPEMAAGIHLPSLVLLRCSSSNIRKLCCLDGDMGWDITMVLFGLNSDQPKFT